MLRQISLQPTQLHAWRLLRHFSSAAAGYSSSWRTIDEEEDEDNASLLDPPDPLGYLQGFDAVPEIEAYKNALFTACDLRKGDYMLDVGCGTATAVPRFANQVGPTGKVHCIDISAEMIQDAQLKHANRENVSFQTASTYSLPFPSRTFDVVKEDRVLQHLQRPVEAVEEMRRVTKPGGIVVLGNPDFRSFQMDTVKQRWNDKRRPPVGIDFDLDLATRKVLDGVIPTLASHSDMGLAQPRLLQAAGLGNIEMKVCPIPLIGRQSLEAIVPITFMAQCSHQNGAITADEMDRWLARLEWEGDENLFGVLNMYVCRGVRPLDDKTADGHLVRERPPSGLGLFSGWTPKPKQDVLIKFTNPDAPVELLQDLTDLINEAYAISDTGITLSSSRVKLQHVQEMVERGEILMALDEESNELLGCLQVQIKTKESVNPNSQGLPAQDDEERLAEFTCFAVRSDGKRGRGIGAALIRAAEDHARSQRCPRMQIAILCPADHEPEYKQWLQSYYLGLGYEHRASPRLRFRQDEQGVVTEDELHEMYDPLHQLVQCKAIIMEKMI